MTGCRWPGPWSSICTRSIAAARLFATHFHELTALAAKLPRLACHTLRVKEWRGEVVFLHEVAPGTADRSYGIHVARLAGLPEPVLRRATAVLKRLEQGEARSAPGRAGRRPAAVRRHAARAGRRPPSAAGPSPVERLLAEIDPDELTAKEALDLVYRLKKCLVENGGRGAHPRLIPPRRVLARATSSVDAPWSGRASPWAPR